MTPPNLHPIAKTTLRIVVSSALFLAVDCLVDCSGLGKFADYHDFLKGQQETLIETNTEKQIAKAIGKLFVQTQAFQLG